MRQYRILYRGSGSDKFVPLQPIVHRGIYDRPEIAKGVETIRSTPYIEGVAIRLGTEMFNIVSFDQEAEAPLAFTFEEPAPTFTGVIYDQPEAGGEVCTNEGGCCGGCPSGVEGADGKE